MYTPEIVAIVSFRFDVGHILVLILILTIEMQLEVFFDIDEPIVEIDKVAPCLDCFSSLRVCQSTWRLIVDLSSYIRPALKSDWVVPRSCAIGDTWVK